MQAAFTRSRSWLRGVSSIELAPTARGERGSGGLLDPACRIDQHGSEADARRLSLGGGSMLNLFSALLLSAVLPVGESPAALPLPHFPDRFHAFVWRNWQLTPIERMAAATGASPGEIRAVGESMGLSAPPSISAEQWRRSYVTVIRANWHLLPYDQLLKLLDWSAEEVAFTLREDDFLMVKLGNLKPQCETLAYAPPDAATRARAKEIAAILAEAFPERVGQLQEPLFDFVEELSAPVAGEPTLPAAQTTEAPRYCYSYFALYGDPLLDDDLDPYPDGYLARLRASGVNGVWLQGVLPKLTPFPWEPALSAGYETRLKNLAALVARAKRHGIGVYLYLNEPRSMPVAWFDAHPELKGGTEGDYAALCTSHPEVQRYLREGAATIVRSVPDLAGIFTISASENLTSCWSHYQGKSCPRCSGRAPGDVIAEVNALIGEGVRSAGSSTRMIAWDWGWQDQWAEAAIAAMPVENAVMSVSEWSLPIERGGVKATVGEYSISAIGPGPRAERQWKAAKERGMPAFAKLQVGTTWELGSVPYLPAMMNVAEHMGRLRAANVDGVMLGWTLGGYPSPNLETASRVLQGESPAEALQATATRRFGATHGAGVLRAWREFSDGLKQYPYDGGVVYNGPHHVGPANLLWERPTGYRATMVGIPYDDVNGWRGPYPAEILAKQFSLVADGFDRGVSELKAERATAEQGEFDDALRREESVGEAAAILFRSAANQTRFVLARDRLATLGPDDDAGPTLQELETLLRAEIELARRLYAVQSSDSRIGFEATNHYFFTPLDLAEKVLNCRDLLDRWLPAERQRLANLR